jgi:DNA-binding transcriptional ArsR family regulator
MVETGTGYDLLVTALVVADRHTMGRLDEAQAIRAAAATIDGGAVRRTIEAISREPWISLLGFVHAQATDRSAAGVLAAMRAAEPRDLVLTALGYHRRAMRDETPPEVMAAAIDGDRAAIREFRRTSFPHLRHWQRTLKAVLGLPAAEVASMLVGALEGLHRGVFAALEARVGSTETADAARARDLVETGGFDAALGELAPSLTFERPIEQSTIVLVPSVVIRPAWALTDHASSLVIAYPAPAERAETVVPQRLVRIASALGDELRLRVIRELAEEPATISDLADRLGVPRTSLQYHVRLLADAGLVVLAADDARWGRLMIRTEAIRELGSLAEDWVSVAARPVAART